MIRNVVMVKLPDDHDRAWAADLRSRFAALNCPGTLSYTIGPDMGLRDGNWSFTIVADFADEESYRAYDVDEEHNRLRAELASEAEQVARMQFEL